MQPVYKLTIFINTLPVNKRSGGIKTFLLELVNALALSPSKDFNYKLLCTRENNELFQHLTQFQNFEVIILNVDNTNPFKRILFEQFKLNGILKNQKNSILLNICNVAVMNCSIPQVLIIQAPLSIAALRKTLPEKFALISLFHRLYYDLLQQKSIRMAVKTVAVSEFMRTYLGDLKDKVEVIHEGVNFHHFNTVSSNISKINNLPVDKYILTVSTLFPYKNMDKVIEAFAMIKQKGYDYKLVIAGKDPDGKQLEILQSIASKNNLTNDVIFLGMVPYEQVPLLYKNACLFLFLSSVETFGLPVLEAMVSGVPVIASNKMSLPEIVNDAGVLVDPENINDIVFQVEKLLASQQERKVLIEKGKMNVRLFNWKNTAEKFEKLFAGTLQCFATIPEN